MAPGTKKTLCLLALAAAALLLFHWHKRPRSHPRRVGGNLVEVQMEHCACTRTIARVNHGGEDHKADVEADQEASIIRLDNTTCSKDAFERGPGQKVVSFSFYGDVNAAYAKKKGYFDGIVGNLQLMPTFYPGWTMRLYFDLDADDPIMAELCHLACADSTLDLCHAGKLPGTPMRDARKVFAMNWRFFPTLDPQVHLVASRDLDSRFSDREVAAVAQWVLGGRSLHVMRDHPHHGTAILGSAWGANLDSNNDTRNRWRRAWTTAMNKKLLFAPREGWGHDQIFLARYVWPWAKKNSLCHDSFFCKKYSHAEAFPTRREKKPNNFVAAVYLNNKTLWQECPHKCRPKAHKDWLHC